MRYLTERKGARRRGTRTVMALALAGGAAVAVWAARDVPLAFGGRSTGARAERMRRSPQYHDGAFHNAQASHPMPPGSGRQMLRDLVTGRGRRRPSGAVPLADPSLATRPSGQALNVIWFGHASTLVEIEGRRVLFDPVWSLRCSPSARVGPRRMHPPPVPLERLGPLDAIVISHDHYDHLDLATVRTLVGTQSAPFVVPLGVGAHLDRWGVPAARVIELDWDESVPVAGLRLTATAARHFSGRAFSRDDTLWGSWVLAGRARRVFYTGDTGYFPGFADIGAAHGPFDATLMQIGAYAAGWPDIHMTPEEAVSAHLDLRGGLLIPVHWATFNLAFHGWAEPADRIWREAKARDVAVAVPRPGERVDVDAPPPVDGWWQTIA
jgi:L-ascorbate metabolism protein UlaG (beta-lactamase superfamily)